MLSPGGEMGNVPLVTRALGEKIRPRGLKPQSFWGSYAALKRRSSTVLQAVVDLAEKSAYLRG